MGQIISEEKMITVRLKGGLGNQMFQYAFGRSLSIKRGVALAFDLRFINDRHPRRRFVFRRFDLDLFGLQPTTTYPLRYPLCSIYPIIAFEKVVRSVKIKKPIFRKECYFEGGHDFDPDVLDDLNTNWFDGYFQSYRYFSNHDDIIRDDFKTADNWQGNLKQIVNQIQASESVCLNVRRTDFVGGGSVSALGQQYYEAAYEAIRKCVTNSKIFVFSDDIPWCRENLRFLERPTFVTHDLKGERFLDYFRLMKCCKHFIIPNSTFAWWAAYLSETCEKRAGMIVAPSKWYDDCNSDNRELLLEWWLKVS